MIFFILAVVPISVALYIVAALFFKIPSFKAGKNIHAKAKGNEDKKKPPITEAIAKQTAQYIPVSLAKDIKLTALLQRSDVSLTPKEFVALQFVTFFVWAVPGALVLIIPLPIYINYILGGFLIFAGFFQARSLQKNLKGMAQKHQSAIEADLAQFIEMFTHTMKTSRNVEKAFDNYIQNYDNPLSRELKKAVADMRTGNQEKALTRLDARISNPLFSQLVRGIIASMRGDDMRLHFSEIAHKVEKFREQRMIAIAQAVKPKIAAMSMQLSIWCIISLVLVSGIIAVTGMPR